MFLRTWATEIQARAHHNKAACALANKLARVCYAVLRDHTPFGSPQPRQEKKLTRTVFCHCCLKGETVFLLFPHPRVCFETDRPSWLIGSHPHGLTPLTLPAASCVPLVSDWRSVGRFHVGTGQIEPTIDAGYTTACIIQQPNLSVSFLACWGGAICALLLCRRQMGLNRATHRRPTPSCLSLIKQRIL